MFVERDSISLDTSSSSSLSGGNSLINLAKDCVSLTVCSLSHNGFKYCEATLAAL